MGIAERSRARVEDLLSDFERRYDAFPVNQRTLSVSGDRYERARREYPDGAVDTYVRIESPDGDVLQATGDGDAGLPGGLDYPDEAIEHEIQARVAAETGVECTIEGLAEVTIAGLSNADDEDAPVLYWLVPVFAACYSGGEPEEGVEWQPDDSAAVVHAFV